MNAHTKALKIADEIGKPGNAPFIERQLNANRFGSQDIADKVEARREHVRGLCDPICRAAMDAEIARLAAVQRASLSVSEQRLVDAKAATKGFTDEQRARLAIFLIDGIERIGDDLRVEVEDCLAEVLSGVRT